MIEIIERLRRILNSHEPGTSRRELLQFLVAKLFDLALASTLTACLLIVAGICLAGVLVLWMGYNIGGTIILAIAGGTGATVMCVYCFLQSFLSRQVDRVMDVLTRSGSRSKIGDSKRTDITSTSAISVVAPTERDTLVE